MIVIFITYFLRGIHFMNLSFGVMNRFLSQIIQRYRIPHVMQCSKQESKIHSFNCKGGVQKFLLNRLNDTYSGIPDVVHDELDFVLVLGRPGGRDVDHPGEELRTVRYHVEIQLPSEE